MISIDRGRQAIRAARRQYDKAVERHFVEAHRLVVEGKPDAAERIAKGAVALRQDAHYELRADECEHRDSYGSTIILGETPAHAPVCMLCDKRFPKFEVVR